MVPILQLRGSLTLVEHGVHFPYIRFVVYHPAVDFDPCMSLEGHALSSDNHLGRYAMTFQQTCGSSRALKTEHFLPVPDTSHING
jgi:hypothetical protein